MELKVFAIDLDGTLISHLKFIRNKNLIAINKYIKAGGIVIIATGKTFDGAIKYVKKINKFCDYKIPYLACLNGNLVYDLIENKIIYKNFINNKLSHEIAFIVEKHDSRFVSYCEKELEERKVVLANWKSPIFFSSIFPKWNFIPITKNLIVKSYKINIVPKLFQREKSLAAYEEIKKIQEIDIYLTHKYLYEIVKKGSNKGNALTLISNELNISLNNFACIGNSQNDISMFKVVKKAIAIKNNNPDYLKHADEVIKIKYQLNVKYAIENFLLKG